MAETLTIDATWERDAAVWIATSADVPGLVVEAATWTEMMSAVGDVLPELLGALGRSEAAALTFRAEEHLSLSAA